MSLMADKHVLVTGSIAGRIPHGDGFLDVTDDVLTFDSLEEAQAAAESIELEHAVRGTHPVQLECEPLNRRGEIHPGALGYSDEYIAEHRKAHQALNKKVGR